MSEIIVLTGAYGVGKSEFAVQLALMKKPCVIADIDVLNPYFRPREISEWLKTQDIQVTGSHLSLSVNLDVPALSTAFSGTITQGKTLIIDCAGSENGLKPLMGFIELLKDAEVWLVVNANRPESMLEQIQALIGLFETRSGLKVTGLVHNTHLLDETSAEMILGAQRDLEILAKQLDLPIRYTMMPKHLETQLKPWIHNPILGFETLRLRSGWMKGNTL